MLQTIQYGRLYAPAEDPTKPNERKVVHLETDIDMIRQDMQGHSIKEMLGKQIYVSQKHPGDEVKDAIWLEVTGTRISSGT